MVSSKQEELGLGPDWSRAYIHQEYPKCKYHWSGKDVTVKNADEEAALGGGWANTPAAFAPYKGPRTAGKEHHPEPWVDEWPVAGLSSDDRKQIKARLWKADSEFWKAPDAPSADMSAMRRAFDLIAEVLFSSGILTEQLLRDQLPALVWDSAIAAGWWRLASEIPMDMFRERLGHYWVWRKSDLAVRSSGATREGSRSEPAESTPSDATGDHIGFVSSEGLKTSSVQSKAKAGTPADRLSEFMKAHPTANYADVRFTAAVYKSDFQDWRKDRMKAESVMAQRIEKVLSGETPLRKKPTNRRPDWFSYLSPPSPSSSYPNSYR